MPKIWFITEEVDTDTDYEERHLDPDVYYSREEDARAEYDRLVAIRQQSHDAEQALYAKQHEQRVAEWRVLKDAGLKGVLDEPKAYVRKFYHPYTLQSAELVTGETPRSQTDPHQFEEGEPW